MTDENYVGKIGGAQDTENIWDKDENKTFMFTLTHVKISVTVDV